MSENLFSVVNSFRGGIKPPDHKETTENIPIRDFMDPEGDMVFLMQQHLGAPAKPVVEVGQHVLRHQLIGEPGGFVSSPVYSSVSGTVKDIRPMRHPNGSMVPAVIIENDHLYEAMSGPYQPADYTQLDAAEIRERIRYAGIVGMGGAGFPTFIKLTPPEDKKIDYVLINGSECEPYLTSDYRVMLEDTERLVVGGAIVRKLFPGSACCFCIENNKPKAIDRLNECIRSRFPDDEDMRVIQLITKYPQGSEKMIIKAATGREVPGNGGLPADVGCIVINIDTVIAVYRAVMQARPLQRRIVTVSGSMVRNPGNYRVRIGTNLRELVEFAGITEEPAKIICGGPMMGLAVDTFDIPVIKTTSSLVLLTAEEARLPEESPCIRCGKCVSACPMHLQPYLLAELADRRDFDAFEKEFGCECIECGSCSFACPAKRQLTQAIKLGRKIGLANRKKRQQEAKK